MKIEITRKIERNETIEIEFPYYYKHDLMLDDIDSVIYGKVEEMHHTKIQISDYYNKRKIFEFEFEERPARQLACYMESEYASSEAEYLSAKAKLLAAAQDA